MWVTNELNALKNQLNRVRPPSVIVFNSNNEWQTLEAGDYDYNHLSSMGLNQPIRLLIPPNFSVWTYQDGQFRGNSTYPSGGNPTRDWGFFYDWSFSSIKIQAA